MKKIILLLLVSIAMHQLANAQQGFGTSTPDKSAIIDMVNATPNANAKGVLMPRVALTSLILAAPVTSPADALTVFNTATAGTAPNNVTPGYYYWSAANNKWVRLLDVIPASTQDLRLVGTNNHISQDAGTGSTGTSVGTGIDNIFIGSGAGNGNTTSNRGIALGTNSQFSNKKDWDNIAIGVNSLKSADANGAATGGSNIAIGTSALEANTTGRNIAVGSITLQSNTTGTDNVAVGYAALNSNQIGKQSIAIGRDALKLSTADDLTAIGYKALAVNTSGINNTALGSKALTANTTGNDNIAIGSKGSLNLTTGSNNLTIGSQVDVPSNTADNQMNIKNSIFGTGLTGTLASPAGNIGINTPAPSNSLHVKAAANPIRLEGLQAGATTDNIVSADATGVLKILKGALPKFFYAPSVVIPTHTSAGVVLSGTQTLDVYAIYAQQFGFSAGVGQARSNASSSLPVLPANQLDYFITYFDTNVFNTVTISTAGVISYTVKSTAVATEATFMNIVFKVQD